MKRCPQCEFIYEDDQTLCDMDGKELVYHAGPVAFEGSSTHSLMNRQDNPWAAESLSVPAVVAQEVTSEKTLTGRFGQRSKRRSEMKRFALTAAAVMFGVLVFLVYHVASRPDVSKPETQNSKLEAPPVLSTSPETPAAVDATAAVSPSSEAIAQDASDAAAATVSNSPEENVDQTNSSISSSHTRNPKIQSSSPDSSASPYRELAANKSKPENITPPKDASVGKHEPVVAKEPATAKPAPAVAHNQPKAVKPEDPKAKKDSKVSSFFKKAGRILKKPF